jgi:hypothetical protein
MVFNLTHSQIILRYKENGGRIEPYTIVIKTIKKLFFKRNFIETYRKLSKNYARNDIALRNALFVPPSCQLENYHEKWRHLTVKRSNLIGH